jgi:hypothetical protein
MFGRNLVKPISIAAWLCGAVSANLVWIVLVGRLESDGPV